MSYPMTFQRVLNRNRLTLGDYANDPGPRASLLPFPNRDKFNADVDYEALLHQHIEELGKTIFSLYGARSMLLGDLRRLEMDAVDERATCQHIAERTGVGIDVVAIVLKEFIAW